MAGTGSYARGEQPRSVPDTLAAPYSRMVAQQRAYNDRQAAQSAQRVGGAGIVAARLGLPLADRMYRPPESDIAELRRQQAAFQKTMRAISDENSWMAVPALAPVAVVAGLGAVGAVASRLAPAAIRPAPFQFVKPDPYLRVGDNWATRAGRRAHEALKRRVAQKPGWEPEPKVRTDNGRILRPDVRTPPRVRKPGKDPEPYQMELKPDTPSGRAAAARALEKYKATNKKTRPIYYDPKPFI